MVTAPGSNTATMKTKFSTEMSTGWVKVDPTDNGWADTGGSSDSGPQVLQDDSVLANKNVGAGLSAALVLAVLAIVYGKVKYSVLKREVKRHQAENAGALEMGNMMMNPMMNNPIFSKWIAEIDPRTREMHMAYHGEDGKKQKSFKTQGVLHPTEVEAVSKQGWKKKKDKQTGRSFFQNKRGESSWQNLRVVQDEMIGRNSMERHKTDASAESYRARHATQSGKAWVPQRCDQSGMTYYEDKGTGVRSWSKSRAFSTSSKGAGFGTRIGSKGGGLGTLVEGEEDTDGEQKVDDGTGMIYFENKVSVSE